MPSGGAKSIPRKPKAAIIIVQVVGSGVLKVVATSWTRETLSNNGPILSPPVAPTMIETVVDESTVIGAEVNVVTGSLEETKMAPVLKRPPRATEKLSGERCARYLHIGRRARRSLAPSVKAFEVMTPASCVEPSRSTHLPEADPGHDAIP